MRKYYIAKTDLGFKVCREKEENGIKKKERRQGSGFTLNKEFAKTYYHLNEATSGLVLAKIKGKIPTTSIKKSESEDGIEKKLWPEL